jgi:hypothetical protein
LEELPQLAPSPYTANSWSNVGGGNSAAEQRRQAAAEKADPKSWVNQTPEQKANFFSNNPIMLGIQTGMTTLMSPFADPKALAESRFIIDRANQIVDAKNMGPPISAMNPAGYVPPAQLNTILGYDMDTPVGALPVVAKMEPEQVSALPTVGESDSTTQNAIAEANRESNAVQESRSNYGGYSGVSPGGYSNSLTDHTDNGDHSGSMAAKGGYITKKTDAEDKPTLEDMLHYIMMRAK